MQESLNILTEGEYWRNFVLRSPLYGEDDEQQFRTPMHQVSLQTFSGLASWLTKCSPKWLNNKTPRRTNVWRETGLVVRLRLLAEEHIVNALRLAINDAITGLRNELSRDIRRSSVDSNPHYEL